VICPCSSEGLTGRAVCSLDKRLVIEGFCVALTRSWRSKTGTRGRMFERDCFPFSGRRLEQSREFLKRVPNIDFASKTA
jgi:hypothetical protein